jgi:hypothetical protein
MIGHQAVGENGYAMSRAILTHPFEIRTPVLVREENILSPITALRDMVRHAGENGPRKPGHLGRISGDNKGVRPLYSLRWASLRRCNRFKPVHAPKASGRLHVATAQRRAHLIKPRSVSNGKVGRPGRVVFNNLNLNFGNELPFMDIFRFAS